MKKALIFVFVIMGMIITHAQTCSTCGKLNAGGSLGHDVGPSFSVSLGVAQYTQSAGHLVFSSSLPDPMLFTPVALQFTAPTRTDVTVITTNMFFTNTVVTTNISTNVIVVTNITYLTNSYYDDTGTNWIPIIIGTNTFFDQEIVVTTNTTTTPTITTNAVVRQVNAPQILADIPVPPTSNGYSINFYLASQVGGVNPDGTYAVSGTPFVTWVITNPAPATFNQLQISQYGNGYGLMKQWTYTYAANTGTWSVTDLVGAQENMVVTNLNSSAYQVVNTLQYSSGPVVQQAITTYANFSWGVAPIQIAVGANGAPQITTYSYYNSGQPQIVTHPNGSWTYYASYDSNGNPLIIYSSFQDISSSDYLNGREVSNTYVPSSAGISNSVDNGTVNPNVPRKVVRYINGNEVSLSYTVFPSVGERLDIQCTNSSAAWNTPGNLVTTNYFYTSGPNQFALQSVIRPDGTMTTYNYITNGIYQTNIIVTGQSDPTYTYIVDGTSNVTVLNRSGYKVSVAAYDVLSGILLSQDSYGNFDNYGRPLQVTHLDGTTEYTQYACCGLENTTDRDGLTKVYLYDAAERQIGYDAFYQGTNQSPVSYQNVLDAAGRTLQSIRIGTDNSSITMSQSAYDLAGELIAQTNALNGVATHTWTNAVTGGFVRTTVNPDRGTVTNSYYADGSLKQVSGTGVHGVRYVYGAGSGYTYTIEIKLNASGGDTTEITTNFMDMLGRTYKIAYSSGSGTPASVFYYNSAGQLASQIDPDGVTTLYQYNAKGELVYTAVAMTSGATSINLGGNDHITYAVNDVTTDHSANVRRTRTYTWGTFSSNTSNLVSTLETSTAGLNTWQSVYRDATTAVTTSSQTAPGSTRVVTTTAPDNSYTISTYSYGRLASVTRYDSTGASIGSTSYVYDPHGRKSTITDARTGATTYRYNNADLVTSVITPAPGTGQSAQTTVTTYDTLLRPTSVLYPDQTSVNSVYLLTGELGLQSGSRTYPVAYSYDYSGRMQTMTNWSNFNSGSGARVTTWNYDSYRGFLASKTYDGGAAGPSYTYTAAGRLQTRLWARGVTTTNAYDNTGSLTNVSYSDSTPGIANTYDRLGRLSTVVRNGMTDTLTRNLANQLLSESFSGGVLNGLTVTNNYDADLRRATLSALSAGSQLLSATYGYDDASRLSSETDGNNNSAAYSYLANSPLLGQITFKQSGTTRMTTSKTYDYLNRLTQISSAASNTVTFNYNYNSANQRVRNALADGSYWVYQYDSLGQVISANKYWSDMTPVAGQQFDYTFDTIGNRTQTQTGGDQNGMNLRIANFHANDLNQLTNRDVPAYVDIKGVSIATNTVTVNGQTAYRKVEYFRDELPANNSSSALWTNILTAATGQNSVTGNIYVAEEPELFRYDPDGNLTNDGRWAYTWDGENRLATMTVNTNVGPQYQLTFAYDSQGRRIQKIVSTNSVAIYTNKFLYDGWNLVSTLSPSGSLIASYMWGNDLSGSQQGAGGVGGLVEVTYYGASTTNCFLAYDGNGNVAALVNAADGTTLANYEYGPFGEVIRATGPMAKINPFRFSTKYDDDESDLLYYGYRYYKPTTGTWPNRDPIEERGGLNLYGMIANDPIDRVDLFGLTYGTISVVTFNSFNGSYTSGLHVRFRWTPPSDHTCCKCSKAVWVQDKSIILNKGIWGIYTTPWQKDWDETDYMSPQQQSDPWTCGGLLKNMDMWDDPEVSGIAGFNLLQYVFRADSRVKCLEGEDKGKIYGGVFWGFDISTFGASKWLSTVGPMVW